MGKLTKRKEAELRLIAELTFDATLAAESKSLEADGKCCPLAGLRAGGFLGHHC